MADFNHYAPTLRKLEGGFVNNPNDKGGATNGGVTLGTYRTYFGKGKTEADLRNITDGEWRFIMKRYWDRCKADEIENQSVAEIFVDWCVNSGTAGIRKAQGVFGLSMDGIVGPKTLAALNGKDSRVVFDRLKTARQSFYRSLVNNDPSQQVFLRGWLNRLNAFSYAE